MSKITAKSRTQPNFSRQYRALVFILVFAVIGVAMVLITRAAAPTASAEPESGTVAAPAVKVTDAAASGGGAVQFKTATNPPTGTDRFGIKQLYPTLSGGQELGV